MDAHITKNLCINAKSFYTIVIVYFKQRIEGCAIESLSKASNHKSDDIPQMSRVDHQVYFILTIHNNPKPMLVISEKLHLKKNL